MNRYYAIFLNPGVNPAFKNKNLRIALNDAIDKPRLLQAIQAEKSGKAIVSPVLSTNSKYEKLNSSEIQKIISEGTKTGSLSINLIVPDINFLKTSAEFIKSEWNRIGVNVELIIIPIDTILEDVIKTNNYEALIFGNILENPEDLFPFWHSSERFYPGLNLALYKNTRADTIIEKIRSLSEAQERAELLKELNSIIISDAPAVFLYSLPYTYVQSPKLKGFSLQKESIAVAAERFENIAKWHILTARVIKDKNSRL